jgi:glucose-1-phosphate adenylyltransferase
MGIYVFNSDFLAKCLIQDAGEPNSPHDFGFAILPRIVKWGQIFAYEFKGYWQDIGTVEAYYEANLQLLDANPGFNIDKGWPILTGSRGLPLSPQSNFGKIINSMISPGCLIEGYVENSILSPGVRVENGAEVINSVVMANTSIGDHSIIDRCILDEKVDIGRYCYVGFGRDAQTGKRGITMVGENVNVPHQTVIGCKSKIWPGLTLSCLNPRLIVPGSVVSIPA